MTTLGERIEQRRVQIGIKSQSELGRRAQVPQSTMNGIITNPYRWSPHLVRIARELQTTVAYLAGEVTDPDASAADISELPEEHRELLELFDTLTPHDRETILRTARALSGIAMPSTQVGEPKKAYRGEKVAS